MALSGFLFLSWRLFELLILIPIVGMLSYFVHQYVHANLLTPDYILVLFIVSVIALAWAVFTTIDYLRARHDALFVGLFDLGLVGALIAGVYYLRFVTHENCTSLSSGLGNGGFYLDFSANKQCTMLKACFALGIIAILAFFVTFLLALLVARNHRNDNRDRVVVKREYRSSSHNHSRQRSRSRGGAGGSQRGSRDMGYGRPAVGGGERRTSRRSSQRREYMV
ncbi:hypothetical protein LTR62_006160 [Meristemomyces frigidus]|uniref:MARVEL domain-containing protein n=1 Tax=Meristemomyces frigidus TaxID=1508187 RepID=A0AAN7TGH4_9PEZI|nr:hypothetical protein LTR62_006160 [Meristemomyces frigidus]